MKTVAQLIEELQKLDPALPVVIEDQEYMSLIAPAPAIKYKEPNSTSETLYNTPTAKFYIDGVWVEKQLAPIVSLCGGAS